MKKWLSLGLVALFFVSFVGLVGCAEAKSSVLKQSVATGQYDLSVVKTIGNHSYIPLGIDGDPDEHLEEILGALKAFETAHPELEITFWQIDKRQRSYVTSPAIFGIWVDHKPKR